MKGMTEGGVRESGVEGSLRSETERECFLCSC